MAASVLSVVLRWRVHRVSLCVWGQAAGGATRVGTGITQGGLACTPHSTVSHLPLPPGLFPLAFCVHLLAEATSECVGPHTPPPPPSVSAETRASRLPCRGSR